MSTSGLPAINSSNARQWRQAISIGLRMTGRKQVEGPPGTNDLDEEHLGLAADIDYDVDEGVLRIAVNGPLDLRCTSRLLAIARAVDDSIASCRLSLEGVTRVFDSGIAALILLAKALTFRGVERIRIEGLDLNRPSLSPYRTGSVASSLRRVFTW